MGCGCSSLKGDDVPAVNNAPTTEPAMEPAKRINTNFSAIDYEQDSHGRRMTEYAPDEISRPKPSRDSTTDQHPPEPGRGADGAGSPASDSNTAVNSDAPARATGHHHDASEDHHQLKPYQTLDGGDWDASATETPPHINGDQGDTPDPTSSLAKDDFAESNDPADPANQESRRQHHRHQHQHQDQLSDNGSGNNGDASNGRKQSWLGQKYAAFQQVKQGRGVQLSDEELKKYTGRDRAELKEWAETQPGVAGNQGAGRIGTDSALAGSAPYAVA